MGTTQSTRTNAKEITFSSPVDGKTKPSSVSGRKITHPEISTTNRNNINVDAVNPEDEEESVTEYVDTDDSLFDENEVYDFDFDDDSDDEEEEEGKLFVVAVVVVVALLFFLLLLFLMLLSPSSRCCLSILLGC